MIKQFLGGGVTLPPLVSYKPVNSTRRLSAPAPQLKAEGSDLTDKDLLKMLGDLNGLPSDMQVLTLTLQNFYIDLQYGLPSSSNIASRYLQVLGQMKTVNAHKKEYDNAFDIVSKNGGINEFAINDRGLLYCVNQEGDFQLLSLEELNSNQDYQALTNSDLLYYRYQSPSLANNNELIKVVQNGIGIETVTKMILDNISNLGTNTESSEGYVRQESNDLMTGLKDFIDASKKSGKYNPSLDDLYKGKLVTKNQALLANEALHYIYRTLPLNAKTLLKMKTNEKTDEAAIQLISSLINSKTSYTQDFSLDRDAAKTKEKDGGKENDLKMNFVSSVQSGHNGHDTIYSLDNGTGIKMTVNGTAYELALTTKGDHIGKTSIDELLNLSGLRSIINADNGIYFGNLKIDQDNLLNITYNGKGLVRINLPIKANGTPDFDLFEEYSAALSEFLLSNLTEADRIKIFSNAKKYPGIATLISPSGELDKSKFAPFIVASGITTDALTTIEDNNKFITEVEQTPDLVLQLKISLSTGSGKEKIVPEIDEFGWAETIFYGINNADQIFKGNIYIPINMNKGAAALGSTLNVRATTGAELEKEYLKRDLDTFLDLSLSLLK